MDLLRSCSRQNIRFVAGNAVLKEQATWYRAAPTATAFPVPHSFSSPVWDTFHPMPTDIGFVAEDPRSYYNGRRLNSSKGDRFAGPVGFFVTGAPAPYPLWRATNGTPVECLTPPFGLFLGGLCTPTVPGIGGMMLGGTAATGTSPLVCASVPSTIHCQVTGGTGSCAVLIGNAFDLTLAAGTWTGTTGSFPDVLVVLANCSGGTWTPSPFFHIIPGTPAQGTSLAPVNFSGTWTFGTDTVTLHFNE